MQRTEKEALTNQIQFQTVFHSCMKCYAMYVKYVRNACLVKHQFQMLKTCLKPVLNKVK